MKNEKQLIFAIHKLYNDYVGWNENAYLDGDEEHFKPFTLNELVEWITSDILNEKDYLELEDSFETMEAKHNRFYGKDFIKQLVTIICETRRNEESWEWEK